MYPHETIEGKRTAIPRNNGELVAVRGPSKTFLCFPEAFQLHRKLAFANFVIGEGLKKYEYR